MKYREKCTFGGLKEWFINTGGLDRLDCMLYHCKPLQYRNDFGVTSIHSSAGGYIQCSGIYLHAKNMCEA